MFNQYGVNEAEGAAMNINFRQIILVLSGQLRAALMSKRVLIGYLIGNGGIKGGVFVWRVCVESSNPNI